MTEKKEEEKPVRTLPEGADASKLTGRKAGIIRSAILTGFLLVLIILAIRDKTPFPESVPQNRYWTDNIVDFLASYKEVIAVVLVLLYGLYRYVRIPRGIPTIVWTAVWAVLIPWLSFVCVEAYNKGYWHVGARVSYENASPMNSMFLLNMLLYYLFFAAMTFLLGGFFAGYAAAAAILMSIAIGNYYVQQFRGSPIVPWDFLSLHTAANVAGGFEYKIFWQMILATLGFVFLLLTIGKMKGKVRFLPLRIIGCVAAFAALFLLIALRSRTATAWIRWRRSPRRRWWSTETPVRVERIVYRMRMKMTSVLKVNHEICQSQVPEWIHQFRRMKRVQRY